VFEPIDIYFERQGPGFWAEPVNALTNLAFVVAAVWLWVAVGRNRPLRMLAVMIGLIGAGSFAFHTFANGLTMLMDVGAIVLFIYAYLAVFLRDVVGVSRRWTAVMLAGMFALHFGGAAVSDGASGAYLPPLAGLIAAGLWAQLRRSPAGPWLLSAAGLFAVSLTLRTIDGHDHIARHVPGGVGTHGLWHGLNAAVLGMAVWGLAQHGTEAQTAEAAGDTGGAGPENIP
jgi:hypothetical protein